MEKDTYLRDEPYTRNDGTVMTLHVWHRPCRTCGTMFEIKTSGNFPIEEGVRGDQQPRNCPLHKGMWISKSGRQMRSIPPWAITQEDDLC